MRYYFALLLMTIVLAGCSPKTVYVPVTETHTSLDTDSLTHLVKQMMASRSSEKEKETVYVFDKTTYTVNDNGDTIGKDRDRVTDRNHERQGERYLLIKELDSLRAAKNRVDTVYQEKPYPVEKTVEVERPLSWWQTALMWCGAAGVAITLYKVARRNRGLD